MLMVFDKHQPEEALYSMLPEEDGVDIHAFRRQGMTISEIVRRTGHDRKTIRGVCVR